MLALVLMHLSMFSPRGMGGRGGGIRRGRYMGHLFKLVLPRVGNMTGKIVPMVGRFECAE